MKNYHTHTKRCYHAMNNDEDYVLAAIKAGYTEIGFSDHTPWKYDSNYISSMRMPLDEFENYIQSLMALREKYKDKISIKIGLECEYFPKYMKWLETFIYEQPIDYIILGNHFDETDETGEYFGWELDESAFIKYVDSCIAGMKTGLYSYLAHPDLGNYNVHTKLYQTEMTRLCKVAKELNIPLEFNLLGYQAKRNYPSKVFFNIVKEVGNDVIIGVDAHEAGALLNKELYNQAYDYLDNLGVSIIEDIQFLKKEG